MWLSVRLWDLIVIRDKERYPKGSWCKKGDWVMFARYAGSRFKIEGGEIRILNEDEVLATIQDPEQILHDTIIIGGTMPDDKEKQQGKLIDIDTSGPGAEVSIPEEKKIEAEPEVEVKDETIEDTAKSGDAPAESDSAA